MKVTKPVMALCTLLLSTNICFVNAQTYTPESAGDFGGAHPNYPASNAIDGNTAFSSRWAATLGGEATNLFVDLGSSQTVGEVGIAWGRGDERQHRFEIRARAGTSGDWTKVYEGTSSGTTSDIEIYDVTNISASQIRVKTFEQLDGSSYTNITEFQIYGPNGPTASNNTSSVTSNVTRTVLFEKNGTAFSIDGAGGAQEGIQVYLWDTNTGNENQHWVETEIDNSFHQYKKFNTNLCWDGGSGAAPRQAITLEICDVNDRDQHWEIVDLGGDIVRLKKRGESFSIDGNNGAARRQALYLWASGNSNVNQQWRVVEINGSGDPNDDNNNDENFGLDPNKEPWENFDLSDWVIDTPAFASDGESQRFGELDWSDISNESRQFFFTHTDGGMRFVTRLDGAKTSTNTSFVRSELREMLRAGADGISTIGVNENNWVLGYQPQNLNLGSGTSSGQDNTPTEVGGRNGVLSATLRVNKVTTTGNGVQVGRTIIGQIHADNDEPARLYYRKEPNHERGCIYVAHEIREGSDVDFDIIGGEDCDNPANGIELDELFSYEIINDNEDIIVIVRRGDQDGPEINRVTIDMNTLNSGYDRDDEWMYFKLGAYTQNNTGDDDDGDIVTFYRINNTHD